MLTGIMTKRFKFLAVTVSLIVLIFTAAIISIPHYSASAEGTAQQPTKRVMNVSGQGIVKASPDIAYVTLGVVTEDVNAQTAQQLNAGAMDKVVAAVKSAGVADTDIQTISYNISPKYTYNKDTGESKISGYTVSNSMQVTVRDITRVGSVVDAAGQNGANQSASIRFGLSDYEKYYNEALKSAVEAARTRAQTMAGTLGVNLSVPVSVSENGGSYYPAGSGSSYDLSKGEAAQGVPTPISSGTIDVRANVTMTYEY